MSSKNISVREDVYRKLERAKGEDESFSDVIERLLSAREGDHPLYGLVGLLDAMIAATALERNRAVVTRNVSEFRRVDGLRVTPY